MKWLTKFFDQLRRSGKPISSWFRIEFNHSEVSISAHPPGDDPWHTVFLWEHVVRVCFEGNGGVSSDCIYVFTSQPHTSYVIPEDATGGELFVKELILRGYFKSDKFRDAVLEPNGRYCWPEDDA